MNSDTRRQVLVVENDQRRLATLGRELEDLGYDSATTWSGVEALCLLQSTSFGFLLVADYLPDIYIGDFLERVLRLPAVPRIWIMQDKPAGEVFICGTGSFRVVDKKKAVHALHARHIN